MSARLGADRGDTFTVDAAATRALRDRPA